MSVLERESVRERGRDGRVSEVCCQHSLMHCEQGRAREQMHTHPPSHFHTVPLVHTRVHTCLHVRTEAEQHLV